MNSMDTAASPATEDGLVSEVTVLLDHGRRDSAEVYEVAQDWLTNAINIDDCLEKTKRVSKITEISGKLKELLQGHFKKLFPVQYIVIPEIIKSQSTSGVLRPHDICVCAPTGSGKTLSYVIPILQLLSQDEFNKKGPRALVVLPVRDLALQVFNVFNGFAKVLGINCVLICGQKNIVDERKDLLEELNGTVFGKADIIVSTPGRLVDHIRNSNQIDFSYIRYLVIDEADRVLDEHKHDWYMSLVKSIDFSKGILNSRKNHKNILSCFTTDNQTYFQKILLSATLTREPHLLHHFDLYYPRLYVVGDKSASNINISDNYSAPKTLHDNFVVCLQEHIKIIFIVDLVRRMKQSKILCFTNTRDTAIRLNQILLEFIGIRSSYLSCQLHPKIRRKLIHDFEQGNIDVLVTVDSMGRGMDIEGVQCVVQYDLALEVHTHIHRVGRTARAGKEGMAYALCSQKQVYHLKKSLSSCNRIIKQIKFSQARYYKYLNEYNKALAKLQGLDIRKSDKQIEKMDDN